MESALNQNFGGACCDGLMTKRHHRGGRGSRAISHPYSDAGSAGRPAARQAPGRQDSWKQDPQSQGLRPRVGGAGEVRLLFVFDAAREAIILVAGDKAGRWSGWYAEAIALAEERYAVYRRENGEKEQ